MDMIQKNKYSWIAWLLPALSFMMMYIARVAPAVFVSQMVEEFSVGTADIGSLTTAYMMPYIIMQIPVGILADRFGPVTLILAATIVGLTGNFLFSISEIFVNIYIARFILGLGSACMFICALKQAKIWVNPRYFAMACGMTQVLGMIGGAVGNGFVSYAVTVLNWRFVMQCITYIWFVLFILMIIFLKNPKNYENDAGSLKDLFKGFRHVLGNVNAWLNGLYAGLLFLPMQILGEFWGPYYLALIHDITMVQSSSLIGCMFIGWAVGGSIIGYIAVRWKCFRLSMILSPVLTLLSLLCGIYLRDCNLFTLSFIFFIIGMCSTGLVNAYAVAADLDAPEIAGSSIAFSNVMSIIIGAILQPLVGVMVAYFSYNSTEIAAFDKVILVLPLSLMLATYCAIRLKLPAHYT